MELMSSSEDESDVALSPAVPVARSKPARVQKQSATPPPMARPKEKPVISARELLLSFLPAAKGQKTLKSPKKEAAMKKAVDAYSFLSLKKPTASPSSLKPQTSLSEGKELSASERIARKYGLKTAAEATIPKGDDISTEVLTSKKKKHVEYYEPTRRNSASPKETPVNSKKRSFWQAQTAGVDGDKKTSTKKYVSPFRSTEGFRDMKQKRRRQKAMEDVLKDEESKGDEVITAKKLPQHVLGSAIETPTDDADDWFSDSKEVDSDEEDVANASNKPEENAKRSISPKQTTPRPGAKSRLQVKPRFQKKVRKQRQDSSDEEGSSEPTPVEEIWPRLPPPLNDVGSMVLPADVENNSDDSAQQLEVCANLNKFLFDYQREGVKFLYSAYQRNTGAVLGDDMGLGKTIQVIAFVSAIMGKHGDHRDKDAWRALLHQRRERYYEGCDKHGNGAEFSFGDEVGPIFVVVPASLLQNWEAELHLWMGCHAIILRGKPVDREAIIDQISRGEFEIVICSYDVLKISLKRLHDIPWQLVILDEMHCLKNPEAQLTKAVKAIKCPRKFGLTGTLMQNNENELHCLVDTIAPGALGSLQEFQVYYGNDIKYGRKKSAVPEAVKRSRQKEAALRKILAPYYLRREKDINPTFQEVSKNDQVVFCDLTPYQLAAYERVLQMPEFELLRSGEKPCDCERDSKNPRKKCCYKIPGDIGRHGLIWERFHEDGACRNCPNCMGLPCVAQLLKISNHMELIKVNPKASPELQECEAEFAAAAFGDDLDAVGGVEQVNSFQQMHAIGTQTCGKMIVLEKLLTVWRKRKERALIFSRTTRMLDIIQWFLITKATKYCRLDGNTRVEDRLQMVNDFNNPDSNTSIFLISTRAGGVGLNLQSATNVVIFDPSWNPAHDCQAQDRAYRIGQKKDVQVYRLITLGTIEEMIYVRQIYKQQLSDTTLKGSKAPRYFEGVQGNPNQRGELFGIANLLCWKPGGVLKGIQDSYQRSRDGLLIQNNHVQYDAMAMKKASKRTKSKKQEEPLDDEGEIIEVADEMVSDMVEKGTLPSQSPVDTKSSDENSAEDDNVEAALGMSAFRHDTIIGEEERDGSDSEMFDVETLPTMQGRVADDTDEGPENDADALLGTTAFRHDDVVGEQHEQQRARQSVHQITQSQDDVIVLDESEPDVVVLSPNLRNSNGVNGRHRSVLSSLNANPRQGHGRLYAPQYQ